MKRNVWLLLLSLIGALCLCLFLGACGEQTQDTLQEEHVHKYRETITLPTCTEKGFTTYTCDCGDSYTDDYTQAMGHSMNNVAAKEPTCTQPGWRAYQICSRCDFKEGYEDLPALGHDMQPIEAKEPTCTEAGWDAYRQCSRCRIMENYTKRQALGHDYRSFEAKEPTCTEAGWDAYEVCTRCQNSTFSYVPALHMRFTLENGETYSVTDLSPECAGGEVTIPATYMRKPVTSIGHGAFYADKRLTTIAIPDSVTSIESQAFMDCDYLKSVSLGNGVTSVGKYAFCNCDVLMRVYITDLAAWCRIRFSDSGSNPMSSAKDLYLGEKKVTEFRIPEGISEIMPYAFYHCSTLESILLPESVTSIGESAFYGCSGWTGNLHIPDSVTSIGENAFNDCSRLQSVAIGKGTLTIKDRAFAGCSGLASMELPDGLISIGAYAFQSDLALTDLPIPDSVISIGKSAFGNCTRLVRWEGDAGYVGRWVVDSRLSAKTVTLRTGTKGIADSAFSICKNLTSVTIPESVVLIGQYAFENCPLESVTFEGDPAWQALKSADVLQVKPVDVSDAAQNAEYLTYDYVDYCWKRADTM